MYYVMAWPKYRDGRGTWFHLKIGVALRLFVDFFLALCKEASDGIAFHCRSGKHRLSLVPFKLCSASFSGFVLLALVW